MGRPPASTIDTPTPERILLAAAEAFATHGHAGATLADIARDAGIRRPSLLYHFPTKQALYDAVVRRTFEVLSAELADVMGTEQPFAARLRTLAVTFAEYLQRHPHHARIVVYEMLAHDGPGQAILTEQVRPLLDGVVGFLEHEGAGHLRPDLPVRAAVLQVACDLLLQHASGPVRDVLWGAHDPERTWVLVRSTFLNEEAS